MAVSLGFQAEVEESGRRVSGKVELSGAPHPNENGGQTSHSPARTLPNPAVAQFQHAWQHPVSRQRLFAIHQKPLRVGRLMAEKSEVV